MMRNRVFDVFFTMIVGILLLLVASAVAGVVIVVAADYGLLPMMLGLLALVEAYIIGKLAISWYMRDRRDKA